MHEAKLIREGAVTHLEQSSLENFEALLRAVDEALLYCIVKTNSA
jgi:hypothetical protein